MEVGSGTCVTGGEGEKDDLNLRSTEGPHSPGPRHRRPMSRLDLNRQPSLPSCLQSLWTRDRREGGRGRGEESSKRTVRPIFLLPYPRNFRPTDSGLEFLWFPNSLVFSDPEKGKGLIKSTQTFLSLTLYGS